MHNVPSLDDVNYAALNMDTERTSGTDKKKSDKDDATPIMTSTGGLEHKIVTNLKTKILTN